MNSSATPGPPRRVQRERGVHLLDEQRTAAEAGEAVVGGVVLEPLLESLALGDVLERPRGSPSRFPSVRSGTERMLTQRAAPSGEDDAQLARRVARCRPSSRRGRIRADMRSRHSG